MVGPSQGLNIYHAELSRHPTNPDAELGQKSGFRTLLSVPLLEEHFLEQYFGFLKKN